MSYFELGGITVPVECFVNFSQTYEPLQASSILRMSDGSAVKQTAWGNKLKINTAGTGWAPVGLTGLNFENALLLKCAVPRSLDNASNVLTLPTARRADPKFIPLGFAVVNNELIETTLGLVGDVATLTTVSGATAYRVHYWPELSVFVKQPPQTWEQGGNVYDWSFEAEQV